jgi:hypothetical protein
MSYSAFLQIDCILEREQAFGDPLGKMPADCDLAI